MGAQARLICFTPFPPCPCWQTETDSLPPVPVEHWAAPAPRVCGWGSASALQLLPVALETNRETWARVLSSFLLLSSFCYSDSTLCAKSQGGREEQEEKRKEGREKSEYIKSRKHILRLNMKAGHAGAATGLVSACCPCVVYGRRSRCHTESSCRNQLWHLASIEECEHWNRTMFVFSCLSTNQSFN